MEGSVGINLSASIKTIALTGLLALVAFCASGQACDCPSISTCSACSGGLTSLTLRFNGSGASTITASDQMGVVFNAIVNPGATFTFNGSLTNQKFVGATVDLKINGS